MTDLTLFASDYSQAVWHLLQESSLFIIVGLLISGLLKTFMSPGYVARHLGKGRFLSVYKAALFGVTIPL